MGQPARSRRALLPKQCTVVMVCHQRPLWQTPSVPERNVLRQLMLALAARRQRSATKQRPRMHIQPVLLFSYFPVLSSFRHSEQAKSLCVGNIPAETKFIFPLLFDVLF